MEGIWLGGIVVDGHSFKELASVFGHLRKRKSDKPLMVIANTTKGKGVSFMEGDPAWHHSVPRGRDLEIARHELSEASKIKKEL